MREKSKGLVVHRASWVLMGTTVGYSPNTPGKMDKKLHGLQQTLCCFPRPAEVKYSSPASRLWSL